MISAVIINFFFEKSECQHATHAKFSHVMCVSHVVVYFELSCVSSRVTQIEPSRITHRVII